MLFLLVLTVFVLTVQVCDAKGGHSLVTMLRHGECGVLSDWRYVGILCVSVLGGQIL